jgi:pimeloyl-ACP methyl ester carboxylesterase
MTSTNAVRAKALAGLPVTDRSIDVNGVRTALLEGGSGPPILLLHGPGGNASHWMRVIPSLVGTHRVIAPDLPGQGASSPTVGGTGTEVIEWLDELVGETCEASPAVVGVTLGGAIGARFAAARAERLDSLVLVDALGLAPFSPAPAFGLALDSFLARPDGTSHDGLWRVCAFDFDRLRTEMGGRWDSMRDYNLDRLGAAETMAGLGTLMQEFALEAIAADELASIAVPTTLVWGRHDLATSLSVAEETSRRHGWPLHVIEDCADEPPIEQPEAFLDVLTSVIADPVGVRS